jgi:ethanolamine utilization protein EutN
MIFARVVGNIVATQKKEDLVGAKLMIVQPIDNFAKDVGDEMIAVDTVGAGIGDLVLVMYEGWAARTCFHSKNPLAPLETVIAGIIDSYETDENKIFQK